MQVESAPSKQRARRPLLFALFLLGGLLIFLFGNNWNSRFPTNDSTAYKWGLVLLFLAVAVVARRTQRLRPYWGVALALSVAALANAVNWLLGNWLAPLLPPLKSHAQELAVDKVAQCIPVVLAILLATWLSGGDLGSVFLKKGSLRKGLRFGLISFGVCAGLFALIALLQAGAPSSTGLTAAGLPLATVVAAIPWILLFALANSLMEELWFRGVFLNRLSPLLGVTATVVVTALVFGVSHLGATYVSPMESVVFPVIVFVLGLVNGFAMLKTDSIWGSMLFHAGYDLLIVIPVLTSMQ
jgi:uncharacterized protein